MRLAFAGFPEPVTSWVHNNRAIPSGKVKVENDFFSFWIIIRIKPFLIKVPQEENKVWEWIMK